MTGNTHDHRAGFLKARRRGKSRLGICVGITAVTMVVEFVAGLLTGSLALISDAGHMLTHGISLIISYFAIILGQRPATSKRTFGLYRAEILAAFLNGAVLLAVSGFIVWRAYLRLLHPVPVAGGWMLVVAAIGLVVNVATALVLWKSAGEDINIRSAFLHMLGDMISSVIVVAGAVIIIKTGWYPIDPILSVVVCAIIIVWAYNLIRESVEVLLEATPRHMDIAKIEKRLSSLGGVKLVHDTHVWSITSGLYAMSGHVEVEDMPISRSCAILKEMGEILKHEFNILHYTIQFETGECVEHPLDH